MRNPFGCTHPERGPRLVRDLERRLTDSSARGSALAAEAHRPGRATGAPGTIFEH